MLSKNAVIRAVYQVGGWIFCGFFVLITVFNLLSVLDVFISNSITQNAFTILKNIEDIENWMPIWLLPFGGFIAGLIYFFSSRLIKKNGELSFKRDSSDRLVLSHLIDKKIVLLVLPITIGIVVILQRFRVVMGMQGFDSPTYLYLGESVAQHGLSTILQSTKPLISLMMYVLYGIIGDNFELFGILLPILSGIFYILGVSFVSYKITSNKTISFLAACCAPLSFIFIRLSYDLYANLMANIVLFLALLILSRIKRISESNNTSQTILLLILTTTLFFMHFWSAVVFFSFSLLFILMLWINSLRKTKQRKSKGSGRLHFKLIVLYIGLVLCILIIKFDRVLWFLDIMVHELGFFTVPESWQWIPASEVPIVWLLSLIGIYHISKFDENYAFVVSCWIIYLFTLPFITGYRWSYRFFLLYPLPMLTGAGIHGVYEKLKSTMNQNSKITFTYRKVFSTLAVLCIMSTMLGETVVRAYIPQFTYRPTQKQIEQMLWIRANFGFENRSITCIISPKKLPAYNWAVMILGQWSIYIGDLIDLIAEKFYFNCSNSTDWSKQNIIVASELYDMESSPLALTLEELSENIFMVKKYQFGNPGFETGDLSLWWVKGEGVVRVQSSIVYSGKYSCQISPQANAYIYIYTKGFFPCCQNYPVSFSCALKADENIAHSWIKINWYNSTKKFIGASWSTDFGGGYNWSVKTIIKTPPEEARFYSIVVQFGSTNVSGNGYVDLAINQ